MKNQGIGEEGYGRVVCDIGEHCEQHCIADVNRDYFNYELQYLEHGKAGPI